MREFAFRAWDTQENRMIDDFLNFAGWKARESLSNPWHDDRYIKEQFTGLDVFLVKDNKKVFVGDIVLLTDHTMQETFESFGAICTMLMTRKYEVIWHEMGFALKLITDDMFFVKPVIHQMPTQNVTYEVIGNIHEAKERQS